MTVRVFLVIVFLVFMFDKNVHSSEECGHLGNKNNIPWNVGVYQQDINKLELLCLGTIIKDNIIVTAAHCLYDQNGKLKSGEFYISTGKLDRYTKDTSTNLQRVEKGKIFIHSAFKAEVKKADIAIIVLETKLKNGAITPICIDWDNTTPTLQDGEILRHPIWQNENLKLIDVSYVDYEYCEYLAAEFLRNLYSSDKICAKSNTDIKEKLDDGAGLIYINSLDNLWYIRGVVSAQDPERSSLTAYTNIILYLNWLSNISAGQ